MSDRGHVGLGILGLGWWGGELAAAIAKIEEARIVSCFARGEEGRSAFAAKVGCRAARSLDELLSDPEVEGVLVATSHASHLELVEAIASAGKAVFVEKPLATKVDEAAQAVRAAEAAGVVLQVGHQRRRTAANRRIRQLIDEGLIGDIQSLHGHQSIPNGFKMPAHAWRWDAEQSPLGSMTSLGIHKLDSMRYHAGPIESVFCRSRPGRDVSIDESTALVVEFESGAVGTLLTSFFVPVISELAVFGTEGAAYNTADGTRLQYQKRGEAIRSEIELDPVDPVVDQLTEFARAIRGGPAPEVGGREGLEIVSILSAAVESSRTGRIVSVADHRP